MTDDNFKSKLTPEQYRVLREGGTEYPGTGEYLHFEENGDYRCAACNTLLFHSDAKYDTEIASLAGWPSFADPAAIDAVELRDDDSFGMHRTEVICKTCGSHLGHVFDDPSSPSGKHYCINSVALDFKKSN